MNRTTFRLVFVISCAHAMAHFFELSLPAVEHNIASEYYPQDAAAGKLFTGWLSFTWRLPWGCGALLVGWLVDRYGSTRMLTIYLLGGAAACLLAGLQLSVPVLLVVMFTMGSFASIYHPAGLTLISHCTTTENRPRALGMHGVIGSAGIAMAPLLAGLVLLLGYEWRNYYQLLALLAGLFGCWMLLRGRQMTVVSQQLKDEGQQAEAMSGNADPEDAHWQAFFVLCVLAALMGMIYAGVLTFLRRFLGMDATTAVNDPAMMRAYFLMALVLLTGCIGQYVAGRIAHSDALELQLTLVCLSNAPLLVWMGFASDNTRLLAAMVFSLIHFMNQPIYNSLIAKYTPSSRRSLCYGFSFLMGFGVGGLGAPLAGAIQGETTIYLVFSGIAVMAGIMGGLLCIINRRQQAVENS